MPSRREPNPHFYPAGLDPESPEPPHGPIHDRPHPGLYYRAPSPPRRPAADRPKSRRLPRILTPAARSRTPTPPPPRNRGSPPPSQEFIEGESFFPQRRSQRKQSQEHGRNDRRAPTPAPPEKQRQLKSPPLPLPPPPARYTQETHPSNLRIPAPKSKTNPLAWMVAVFCTVFWVAVILGLLAILVIYLVYRPKSPKFDISSATLNAAYLDMGYLLNSDLTLLANFTNPNRKGRVDFHYAAVDLYHDSHPIASTSVEPFSMMNHEYKFREIHLVSSQVGLSSDHSAKLRNQMEKGRVRFEVKGLFRVRLDLGGFLKYTYWLSSHCTFMVTGPPTGILRGKKCSTKRI